MGGDPVEDEDAEEDVGVAAGQADPAGFAFEDHEDCKIHCTSSKSGT